MSSTIDFDAVRAGLDAAVPFNRHLGLEITSLAPGAAVVTLPDDERLRNHVASQHAAGLFAAGEAASGAAMVVSFAEHLGALRPLVTRAEIAYVKLARGPISAAATLGVDPVEALARLDADGSVEFAVHVVLTDADGVTVSEMTVHWHVRRT